MGKKSKSKGKGRAAAAGGSGGTAASLSAGAIVVGSGSGRTGGGSETRTKNPRCLKCSCIVKVSRGKGHQCPGCSEVYCSRCEKNCFLLVHCPNGTDCVASQVRRCKDCMTGATLRKAMELQQGTLHGELMLPRGKVEDTLRDREELSSLCISYMCCLDQADGCLGGECGPCFYDEKTRRLASCAICNNVACVSCLKALKQCGKCKKMVCMDCYCSSLLSLASLMSNELRPTVDSTNAELIKIGEEVQAWCPSMPLYKCCNCSVQICVDCATSDEMRRNVKIYASELANHVAEVSDFYNFDRQSSCDRCYFTKKPCTNPDCRNEVGVPTKRCGGCHISRYCSKECQADAYPEHQKQCEKVQLKRIARLSIEAGIFDLD